MCRITPATLTPAIITPLAPPFNGPHGSGVGSAWYPIAVFAMIVMPEVTPVAINTIIAARET